MFSTRGHTHTRTHAHNYTSYTNGKLYSVPFKPFLYSVSCTNVMGFSGDALCQYCVQYGLYRLTWLHTHTHTHTHCSFLLRTVSILLLLGVLYEVKLECLIWRPRPSVRLSPRVSGFTWNSAWVCFTTSCWASCLSWQSAQTGQNFCYEHRQNDTLSCNMKHYEIKWLENTLYSVSTALWSTPLCSSVL